MTITIALVIVAAIAVMMGSLWLSGRAATKAKESMLCLVFSSQDDAPSGEKRSQRFGDPLLTFFVVTLSISI